MANPQEVIWENQEMDGDTPQIAVLKVGNLRGHLFSEKPKPTGLGWVAEG